jgi:aspartate ammonia-lyase
VVENLREETGLALARGENLMDQTANTDAFVEVSGILKACACNLVKISDDLRLLSQREFIRLPAVQAGSSIMPGKVNPVLLEYAIQAGLKVQANDLLVADCASRGSLQICEFIPLLGHALLESLTILSGAIDRLIPFVGKITAQPERCRAALDLSVGLFAVWVPEVGYAQAGAWAAEYVADPRGSVRDFLVNKLGEVRVTEALTPERLTALGYGAGRKGGSP